MATTAFKGSPVNTVGELPAVGAAAPSYDLVGEGLSALTSGDVSGRTVLNIFPSVDTGVCAASVRKFNELAAGFENTTVVNVSKDLPFAQARFCGAEGIENVKVGSAFRSAFGEDFGVTMADGPMAGLLARSVVVLDADGKVVYTELVPEVTQEPDYDSAVAALG
ncbi:MAG: thiol peroxidase [Nocardioides sp.]|nr:thiol peroxidase [Nocardioides sp.]